MKRLLFTVIAASLILSSCSSSSDSEKAKAAADSARIADSLANVAISEQETLDTIIVVIDTTKK
jgi:protein involved in sex pheromone biosynthesis